MDKLKMEARPIDELLKKVAAICPAAVQDNKIDFERLKQELSPELNEDAESYNFTWVGKKDAIMGASTPIRKTLRPCKEESKNWDTTKNLYIEGDNLDVLKLLQESYLGKVKMIYIDPPYNTGNDFVYCDDFADSCEEYMEKKGQCDVETNERLFKNDESNGRFHSNWCTMIYPRLKIARDLLTDDGVIFISIDDHEVANLKKICDEIFGEGNFIAQLIWRKKYGGGKGIRFFVDMHEYILCYGKNINNLSKFAIPRTQEQLEAFTMEDGHIGERGKFYIRPLKSGLAERKTLVYPIECPDGSSITTQWICARDTYEDLLNDDRIVFKKLSSGGYNVYKKFYEKDMDGVLPESILYDLAYNQNGKEEFKSLFDIKEGRDIFFSSPKPSKLIHYLSKIILKQSDIVLDFFSGSATTAHAVMQLNAEDGGNRRFIMVQLPELCDEKSTAFKAGYKNICEIGKERIRRAGDKIVAETGESDLDIGFKVLKLDDTNMEDVYYTPMDTTQKGLLDSVDNIKEDRSELDLLYGVMVDLGLQLDLDVKEVKSGNTTYYNVDDGSLVACFAQNIPDSIIKEIAEIKPLNVVFRDSSFADAPAKINVTEIFKTISPNTKITVL